MPNDQPRSTHGIPRDVAVVFASLVGTAEDDILDQLMSLPCKPRGTTLTPGAQPLVVIIALYEETLR